MLNFQTQTKRDFFIKTSMNMGRISHNF